MSLLGEMRAGRKQVEKRRWGRRTYDPKYCLYRHVEPGDPHKWLDPKPPALPLCRVTEEKPDGTRAYTTRRGAKLDADLIEKFANRLQWTSEMRGELIGLPILEPKVRQPPPKDEPKPHPFLCTVRRKPMRMEVCPQDWQQVQSNHGLLHEAKAWPRVADEYRQFPGNVGPREPQIWTLHNRKGRTEEEQQQVENYIRHLVKEDKLMPQFVRPPVTGHGMFNQTEARPYEQLEKPPDRNPACMESWSHFVHGRFSPSEYKRPKFKRKGPISCTTTVVHPYNCYNLLMPSLSCQNSDKVPWSKPLFQNQF